MRIVTMRVAVMVVVGLLTAGRSMAAPQDDSERWLPWIGCWQAASQPPDTRVCVVPNHVGPGIRVITISTAAATPEQMIVADGAAHPVDEGGCKGMRSTEWTRSGNMLFTRATLTCDNRSVQSVSGLHLLTKGPQWLDIQVSEAGLRSAVAVTRYDRASVPDGLSAMLPPDLLDRAVEASQRQSTRMLTTQDVMELSAKVSTQTIEAALFETGAHFALNSRVLIALDDAGVADELIDLMLALSYPERFAVEPASSSAFAGEDLFPFAGLGWGWLNGLDSWSTMRRFSRPFYCDGFSNGYGNPYGSAYGSAYGNAYYDCQMIRRYPVTGPFSLDTPRIDNGDAPSSPPIIVSQAPGAAVNGHGYTRVRPQTGPASAGNSGTNGNRPSTRSSSAGAESSSGGSSSSSSGGSSSSSSSGSATPSGYSSGSSGGDSGRTAVPRE